MCGVYFKMGDSRSYFFADGEGQADVTEKRV